MNGRCLATTFRVVLFYVGLVAATRAGEGPAPPKAIDFDRQIRPILSNTCFQCHGPDEETRESGLRLDHRDEALRPADSGKPAIVPGKPDQSTLVKRIASSDKRFMMPPPASNKALTPEQKDLLRAWVEQGADYRQHWSFARPTRPALPKVKDESWPRNTIDRFILARLESDGLRPSREADRPTLIRRLALDLTGLPPTPGEVDAFVNDPRSDAYEALVDRLLSSPHYGERMALDWLDAARFADTHGYHIDSGRNMTRWRDWVIDAFNRDLPFDRFTIDQLAGDLVPNATLEQKVASGFNRNHMITFEGGAIPEEYLTAYIVDRVNTTGTVWLGLTVGCTQCHDHKFDPMTQKEFYELYAFFNNVPEQGLDGSKGNAAPMIPAPTKEQQRRLDRLAEAIRETETRLDAPTPAVDAAQAQWEQTTGSERPVVFTALDPAETTSRGGTTLKRLPDRSVQALKGNPATELYTVSSTPEASTVTALRLEALPDDRLVNKGPGRSVNGNFVLTDVRISFAGQPLRIKGVLADFSQQGHPVAYAIDDQPSTGWAVYPEVGKSHEATFALETPVHVDGKTPLSVALAFESPYGQHQLGKFRLAVTGDRDPLGPRTVPSTIAKTLALEGEKRTEAQRRELRRYYRTRVASECRPLAEALERLRRERSEIELGIPTAMVMQEMPKPRDTFMLVRGQYDKHGEKVEAHVPAFLPPLPKDSPRDRLALARWLVDPAHPLTARVTVNRFWQAFFGTGLVKTAEDFGSQGELPSHPALLDWLAVEFVTPESPRTPAWDVKALVRSIVTSATYRQSSVVTPDLVAKDPENRLLARGPRVRLTAEFIRDQALAISGLLNPEIGGRSVSPYQPPGLWEELASRADGANWTAQVYVQGHGTDLYRRTMYTFWKRTSPPPSLMTFDAPDRETCTVRRARTNTPLQALVLLNDPTYVEASRKLAERMMTEGGATADERITFAFRLATARLPSAQERDVVRKVFEAELSVYRTDAAASAKLLSVGESPRNAKLDAAELAAWSTVAGVILNLDETVTKG
ncbi:MAG: PSD1 and planctomycete cytochrome C domain-containing protein [Isosphaeraceae bacterium]|nr:PSD1 and planctomycete cytochrome C domain-containing protein [Isosphaeraceae bacterium]